MAPTILPTAAPVVAAATCDRLGLGVLWRAELAGAVREWTAGGRIGWVEVIAESVGHSLPPDLAGDRLTVVPHGVVLGLGGAAPPDRSRVARLADAVVRTNAPLVSEHLAFVRGDGIEAGHLLPVPRTREALDVVVENVRTAADQLPVPLAIEPIATLVEWPDAELSELAFLLELLDRTDVDLVLDVANIHVNAANRRRAGSTGPDTDPLWPEVETLVEELWARHEIPGLLLERDGNFPATDVLEAELARLDAAATRGRARRPAEQPPPQPKLGHAHAESARACPNFAAQKQLATAQGQFLRAVTGAGPGPPGFDLDDLDAVADVLAYKRATAVAHAFPDLAALPAFDDRFVPWARRHPNRGGGAGADAAGFVRELPRADRTVYATRAAAVARLADRSLRPCVHLWRSRDAVVVAIAVGPWRRVGSL